MSNEEVVEVTPLTWDTLTLTQVQESVTTQLSVRTIADDRGTRLGGLFNLMTYCFGWGVVNDPPMEHDLYDVFNANTLRERRAVWVQHVVCTTFEQSQELMTKIMNYVETNDVDSK